jgi:histidine kinase-like protein
VLGGEVIVIATATPLNGRDAQDVGRGGFPAWPLPFDATAARVARSLVRTVFDAVGMPAGLTHDMAVAISELATNVYVHASSASSANLPRPTSQGAARELPPATGLPEMWAYLRWGRRPEIVLKVFDSAPWHGPITEGSRRPPPTAEGGRGLEVVSALTAEYGGRWGIHRTRSRLGACPVPGKAVFLAVPIPAGCRAGLLRPVRKTGRQVAEEVFGLLAARGMDRMQGSVGHGMAVICVRAGLHVWVLGESISYRLPGSGGVRHVLSDGVEVVEQVVRHCADLDAADREATDREATDREAADREAAGREAAGRDAAGREAVDLDGAERRESAPGDPDSGSRDHRR